MSEATASPGAGWGWVALSRASSLLSGPITAAMLAATLQPEEQGLYYAASALLTWQTFLELGFGASFQQRVSREAAGGDAPRLAGLLRVGLRWYVGMALAWLLFAPVLGGLWLAARSPDSPWRLWIALSVATGLSFPMLGVATFLEGLGDIGAVYRLRVTQSFGGRFVHWLVLAGGGGVWSLVVERVVLLAYAAAWLASRPARAVRSALASEAARLSWRSEIWPLQARVAATTLGGFVPYALLVPSAYGAVGPAAAGRFGLAMALAGALQSGAYSFVIPWIPGLAMRVARGEAGEASATWRHVAARALGVYLVGAIGIVGGAAAASALAMPVAERILGPAGLVAVLASGALALARHLLAVHARSWQEEVLWPVAVGEALVTLVALPVVAGFGVEALAFAWSAQNAVALLAAYALWTRWGAARSYSSA